MGIFRSLMMMIAGLLLIASNVFSQGSATQDGGKDARMQWWREARFGMFIHWGLYSIPAGQWNESKDHAEWIRTTARIPLEEYDKLVEQFNPVEFNAEEWVTIAKNAGMKYIVLTSKHHDGFCLFDSEHTDFDVMATPFRRDILKELADACRKHDMRICWYHSIMDWHHPDYLPRREWETDRSSEGADFNRYFSYLKNQVKEIITEYGDISVLWFDGEWESTWSHDYALQLHQFIRELDPDIIINNRIDVYRDGMAGLNTNEQALGDFGTPEQEIPETGMPGKDWESCMTLNDHWGYNASDSNWKSYRDLLFNLVDIASKGGNYLLNVGPTALGEIPQPSSERLELLGKWMKVNSASVYGTQAGPFKQLKWGKCTRKEISGGSRLYLHVFDWPQSGKLMVTNMINEPLKAFLLSDVKETPLVILKKAGGIEITLPPVAPDSVNSVIVLDIKGSPQVLDNPSFSFGYDPATDKVQVSMASAVNDPKVAVFYSLDGSTPSDKSNRYEKPVAAKLPLDFKAVTYYNNRKIGDVTTASLPLSFGKTVTLKTPPSEKYQAGGASSLTDAMQGTAKFSDGRWLGFEGADAEALVDLGKKTSIRSASIGYLVNVKSWIFEPIEIKVEYSTDGKDYKPLLNRKFNPAMWKSPDAVKRFSDVFPEVSARFVKVTVKNRAVCPQGHSGEGGKAWVFIDEIELN